MKNHQAILALNPSVVTIRSDIAYDVNDNVVAYDKSAVAAYVAANEYKSKRAAEYPNVADQLDTLFHEGIDGWKETIQAVKTKYPKP